METIENTATKTCPKCGQTLPVSEYWKSGTAKDGLYSYCMECAKKLQNAKNSKLRQEKMRKDMLLPFNINDRAKNEPGGADNPLAGFTPRQLMQELYRRGYRGTLEFTTHVDIEKL